MLSQALYGEATGVYCGKSLYAARSMTAARFYLRQARQELNHLELFAEIFRILEMQPEPPHWVIRRLSAHNNYYPLKVLMEHALGEGMVLDVFRDVLMQVLPDADPRVPDIKRRLAVVCREEEEHIAWGEQETRRILGESPWLRWPMYGVLEWQMLLAPRVARSFARPTHPVLRHLGPFVEHVQRRCYAQCVQLGVAPASRPGPATRALAMVAAALLYLRSQFARSRPTLESTYLRELGFQP